MRLKRGLGSYSLLIFTMLMIYLTFPLFASVHPSLGNPDYTYYGVVPSKIYQYRLNDWNASPPNAWSDLSSGWSNGTNFATKSLLAVVAAENRTNVGVYNLTLGSWTQFWAGSLNSMDKQLMLLDNGTTFKVVSDKIVSVLLLNYQTIPLANATTGPLPYSFYTSTDGLYVGKEFVFMASQGRGVTTTLYTVQSVEATSVTVTNATGYAVYKFSLGANSYKFLMFDTFKVYKIESTGNIMIKSGDIPGLGGSTNCFPIPSAEGGFVGTFFITGSTLETGRWDTKRDYGYRVSASEDTQVKVYDLDTGEVISTFSVKGGSGIAVQPRPAADTSAIAVQSDNPITLSLIDNGSIVQSPPLAGGLGGVYSGYPIGVMFVSIRPNQNVPVYLPTDSHVDAYFFASNQTQLTIDGATYTIPAGSCYPYNQPGAHIVESDNNVILQINMWPLTPPYQGLWYNGAAIPCIETANVKPNVTLTPIGGFPTMYVIIGAGAAAVAVVVGLLIMRRRKPS